MKKTFMFLAAAFISLCGSAQVINGDLDGDNDVTVNDAVLLVNDYVTNTRHYVDGAGDGSFAVENSRLVGTWWKSQSSKISFNANGTTDYGSNCTYKYLPGLRVILIYDSTGTPIASLEVIRLTDTLLEYRLIGNVGTLVFSKNNAITLVTGITLSDSRSMVVGDVARITATVTPSDADNKTLAWTSSDEQVASVSSSGIVAAKAQGTTTITATAQDGSGVKAICIIYVRNSGGSSSATRSSGSHNGHDWVDLGTGVKWATMNVGATSPDGYGDYFAWGETTGYDSGKNTFSWANYKWCKGEVSTLTKYCESSAYGTKDAKNVLEPTDDAASKNWGGNWRLPTMAEMEVLRIECYWKWVTTYNGKNVSGYIVYKTKADVDKGKCSTTYTPTGSYSVSDPHIFLPAAGTRGGADTRFYGAGTLGQYWASSLRESCSLYSYRCYFSSSGKVSTDYSYRYVGQSVRAVCQ